LRPLRGINLGAVAKPKHSGSSHKNKKCQKQKPSRLCAENAQEGSVFVHYAAFLIKKCKNRILKNQITCLIIQGNIWNLCKWCVTCAALTLSFYSGGSGAAFAFFFSAGLWVACSAQAYAARISIFILPFFIERSF
jgi:hypothetical protein